MPLSDLGISEHARGRRVKVGMDDQTLERYFTVFGTSNLVGAERDDMESLVQQIVESEVVDTPGIPPYGVIQVNGIDYYLSEFEFDTQDGENWPTTVRYARDARTLLGIQAFSFDTTGGRQKVLHSIETIQKGFAPGEPEFSLDRAINMNGNRIEGVERPLPVFKFTLSGNMRQTDVDMEYALAVKALTGKTNDAPFRGFPRGSVLFLGAKGGWRGNGLAPMSFDFEAEENLTNFYVYTSDGLAVPATDTGFNKEGQQYFWEYFVPRTENNKTVPRLIAGFVEKVSHYGDFSKLKIPVAP